MILYHYTTEKGCEEIVATMMLKPSLQALNPRDARHGDGQYLSDIVPGTRTLGQLAYLLLNDARGWRRFTHFVAIETDDIGECEECRPGVFRIPGSADLTLVGRLIDFGPVPVRA